MQVNIYIYIDSCYGRKSEKHYGYVLETKKQDGTPVTAEGFGTVEATYNGATLTAIVEAMRRIKKPCTVQVMTDNDFIANAAAHDLPVWAENGYQKKKGGDIANRELWENVWKLWKSQKVLMILGKNEYSDWLRRETARRTEEKN